MCEKQQFAFAVEVGQIVVSSCKHRVHRAKREIDVVISLITHLGYYARALWWRLLRETRAEMEGELRWKLLQLFMAVYVYCFKPL